MSDAHLRELERAAASGDRDAQTRLLRERIRADDLERDRLELAAYLGDPASRQVVSELDEDAASRLAQIDVLPQEDWIRGLESWKREAVVRAAVAAGRSVLPQWEGWAGWQAEATAAGVVLREASADHDYTVSIEQALVPRRALEAAEAWIGCPCRLHVVAAEEKSWGSSSNPANAACLAAARSMVVTDFAVQSVLDASEAMGPAPLGQLRAREAIRDAVVPWALGTGDPIPQEPRLPRPEPFAEEWLKRGWTATWERKRDAGQVRVTLHVTLGDWDEDEVQTFPDPEPPDHKDQVIKALDTRLWNDRRWLPPGLEGQGFTRTMRVPGGEDDATRRWPSTD